VPSWVGTRGYCSWSQLRTMQEAGWSVQSHTLSHPFLSSLDRAALWRELADSRRAIEDAMGAPVVTLALPNGDWPARAHRDLLGETGYRYIATSRWHANGDAEQRRGVFGRYTIRRETTLEAFKQLLRTLPGHLSGEGLRLATLSLVRSALGVHRYRAIRRYLLDGRGKGRHADVVSQR
jgi:peptidoglycan/xylan/chitin deacetylase (PgdA/CDA1 family)